jgi:hypothetical protein
VSIEPSSQWKPYFVNSVETSSIGHNSPTEMSWTLDLSPIGNRTQNKNESSIKTYEEVIQNANSQTLLTDDSGNSDVNDSSVAINYNEGSMEKSKDLEDQIRRLKRQVLYRLSIVIFNILFRRPKL